MCRFKCTLSLSVFRGLDFSSPWRDDYESARASLQSSLHITHPIMRDMLKIWDKYRDNYLLDLTTVRSEFKQLFHNVCGIIMCVCVCVCACIHVSMHLVEICNNFKIAGKI